MDRSWVESADVIFAINGLELLIFKLKRSSSAISEQCIDMLLIIFAKSSNYPLPC